VKDAGVAAIPISAFYEAAPVTHLIRLCFPKRDATLEEGAKRLAKARELSIRSGTGPA
jgi:N-succinyldiaminopimelate aminotransferase